VGVILPFEKTTDVVANMRFRFCCCRSPPRVLLKFTYSLFVWNPRFFKALKSPQAMLRHTAVAAVLFSAFSGVSSETVPKGAFIENNHLVVIEAESGLPDDAKVGDTIGDCGGGGCWKLENTDQGYDGSTFGGKGYLTWHGQDWFNSPGKGKHIAAARASSDQGRLANIFMFTLGVSMCECVCIYVIIEKYCHYVKLDTIDRRAS
jgi:hypothetical protein